MCDALIPLDPAGPVVGGPGRPWFQGWGVLHVLESWVEAPRPLTVAPCSRLLITVESVPPSSLVPRPPDHRPPGQGALRTLRSALRALLEQQSRFTGSAVQLAACNPQSAACSLFHIGFRACHASPARPASPAASRLAVPPPAKQPGERVPPSRGQPCSQRQRQPEPASPHGRMPHAACLVACASLSSLSRIFIKHPLLPWHIIAPPSEPPPCPQPASPVQDPGPPPPMLLIPTLASQDP